MKKLKYLRKKNNISYSKMASLLNISKSFYFQIENDKRRLSYNMAYNISMVFGLNPDDIFYEDFKGK